MCSRRIGRRVLCTKATPAQDHEELCYIGLQLGLPSSLPISGMRERDPQADPSACNLEHGTDRPYSSCAGEFHPKPQGKSNILGHHLQACKEGPPSQLKHVTFPIPSVARAAHFDSSAWEGIPATGHAGDVRVMTMWTFFEVLVDLNVVDEAQVINVDGQLRVVNGANLARPPRPRKAISVDAGHRPRAWFDIDSWMRSGMDYSG